MTKNQKIKRLETILGKLEVLQHLTEDESQRFRDCLQNAKSKLMDALSSLETITKSNPCWYKH